MDALTSFAALAARLSGERVAMELRKILTHAACAPAVGLLHQTGLDKASLGCALLVANVPLNPQDLRVVTADFGWLVLLAAILPQANATSVLQRLRLSRAEQKFCGQLALSNPAQIFAELTAPNWQQSVFTLMSAQPLITPVPHGGWVKCCNHSITNYYIDGKRHNYQFQVQTYCRTALTMDQLSVTC